MRRAPPASSRSSSSSPARTSSRAARGASRRFRTRRASSASSARPRCRRAARDDARALARGGSRQRRHAAARRGRFRRRGCALRGLRRSAWPEGASRVGGRDLSRAAAPFDDAPERASRSSPTAVRRCTSSSSPARSTFVLGAERKACQRIVEQHYVATIVTPGAAESLNVAVAGAIALYERSRRGYRAPARNQRIAAADVAADLVAAAEPPVLDRIAGVAELADDRVARPPIGSTVSRVPCKTKTRGMPSCPRRSRRARAPSSPGRVAVREPERQRVRPAVREAADRDGGRSSSACTPRPAPY